MRLKKWSMILLAATAMVVLAGCGTKAGTNTTAGGTNNTGTEAGETQKSWSKMPAMAIDESKTYLAHFKTSKGDFTAELYAKDAPKTVNSFVFLSKEKFYEGVKVHRVIETFMIQTGDPKGNGTGGPGYTVPDELKNGHTYEEGTLAMANAGPNTNGSQFFICTGPDLEGLNANPNYSIFGKVVEGMDVVHSIAKVPVEAANGEVSKPKEEITINSITIEEK
ncbi:peptidylprolyl isomerase [Paenibacillus mendelii]|uniref:Peptidyl-prolyl cis-trans isomerase n=1 Tax=Paenibacillus mendelii TaxID=206163 RepID=A0ABV6J6J4_9BACL|nr:peptidylprolyl isomerase [Paenibacillus mendelii]MCQ6560183.1 peptidylprolyl isomerase [Paenibacillus mendelii]